MAADPSDDTGLRTPADLDGFDPDRDLGPPGSFPYTRGVHPTMYRGRTWTMRQYAGFGDAAETNRRFRYLLDEGQTGLSVAFDLPTQIGYDSDEALAEGEVGRVGVPISSLEDMETLLDGIPLGEVSVSMTINATASVLMAFLVATARTRGVDPAGLSGTVQNDILKEFVARGTQRFPVGPSMRLVTDVIAYAAESMPKWNPISISGYHMREAGCTAAEEVGFTLGHALAYVEAARSRGFETDAFAGRLSFFFGAHNRILEEAAKFRAARRLWARLMKERYGVDGPAARLRFHTQTCGSTLTAQQPENNVVRVAYQALAAVLGGTQSLHTNSKDEALGLPTESSVRTALRTQQVLACESGVPDAIDPLGGSYYVESETDRIEEEARGLIAEMESRGGAVACAETGWTAGRIAESAYRAQQAIDRGAQRVVGVNCYRSEDPPSDGGEKIDPGVRERRAEGLARFRAARDAKAVTTALDRIRREAASDANVLPGLVDAVAAGVTLGEIVGAWVEVFGEAG